MYMLLLILLIAGGFLVYALIRLIQQEIQSRRSYEAYRDYIMAYGSEEEKQALMLEDLDDMFIGMIGLAMVDMLDGELDGEIDFW